MPEVLSPFLAPTPEMLALESFCATVDPRTGLWLRTNALELAYNAHDFTGADLGDDSIASALLSPLSDAMARDSFRERAATAIKGYRDGIESHSSSRDWAFIRALLADSVALRGIERSFLRDAYPKLQIGDRLQYSDERFSFPARRKFPMAVGEKPQDERFYGVSLAKQKRMSETHILESLVFRAGRNYLNLTTPHGRDERIVLGDIAVAKAIHAPLAEKLGFYGLSMTVLNAAGLLELARDPSAGQYLELTQKELANLNDKNRVALATTVVLEKLLGADIASQSSITDKSGHGMIVTEHVIASKHLPKGTLISGIDRLKTEYSATKKWRKEKQRPADLLGITVVVDDEEQLAELFSSACNNAVNAIAKGELALGKSSKRAQAFHVRGTRERVDYVLRRIKIKSPLKDNDVEIMIPNNTYYTAKIFVVVTVDGLEYPVELQIQTADDRADAQTGLSAHSEHAKMKTDEGVVVDITSAQHLKDIRACKRNLGKKYIPPVSLARSIAFESDIDTHAA